MKKNQWKQTINDAKRLDTATQRNEEFSIPEGFPPIGSTVYIGSESGLVKSYYSLADGTQIQICGAKLFGSYFLKDVSISSQGYSGVEDF